MASYPYRRGPTTPCSNNHHTIRKHWGKTVKYSPLKLQCVLINKWGPCVRVINSPFYMYKKTKTSQTESQLSEHTTGTLLTVLWRWRPHCKTQRRRALIESHCKFLAQSDQEAGLGPSHVASSAGPAMGQRRGLT